MLAVLVLLLTFLVAPAWAQVTMTGAGKGSPASYIGPGDISSGAYAWWGLRAYSAATAGTKAANVCDTATGSTCSDVNTLANGAFDAATAAALSQCATSCSIKTLYDQTNGNNCSSSTCDLTQAAAANRPVLTFNCIGTQPCMTWTSGMSLRSASNATSASQPISISAVGKRTGSFTSYADLTSSSAGGVIQVGFSDTANTALGYAGTVGTASATDSTTHAISVLANGASSKINVDGSSSSVSIGASGISGVFCMGNCNNGLAGISVEAGWWTSDNSSSFGTLSTNAHSFWGF